MFPAPVFSRPHVRVGVTSTRWVRNALAAREGGTVIRIPWLIAACSVSAWCWFYLLTWGQMALAAIRGTW